jgi:hypothetical protein
MFKTTFTRHFVHYEQLGIRLKYTAFSCLVQINYRLAFISATCEMRNNGQDAFIRHNDVMKPETIL